MDSAKAQLAESLKSASNVLVTVNRDPSIDQLAALLGLSLILNKQGKHCAAVFSGKVPSVIEFLNPAETLEATTDSLRDFIISLDKSKADKLRYKVEDNVVRIFITPYKTSITDDDLEFSQGDFNVDLVVALGVKQQEDLDQAITAHGRILHDATLATINLSSEGGLGSINWHEPAASSLSELVTELVEIIDTELLDEQIATALLTGIVAETDRFSNDKTTSQTMGLAADLMAAGANQQLVASKLEEDQPAAEEGSVDSDESADGTLQISHAEKTKETPGSTKVDLPELELPSPEETPEEATEETPEESKASTEPETSHIEGPKLVTEPPQMGGTLTANSAEPALDPVTDPLSMPTAEHPQLLERKANPVLPSTSDAVAPSDGWANQNFTPPPPSWSPPPAAADATTTPPPALDKENESLTDLEKSVNSPHVGSGQAMTTDARDEVDKALSTDNSDTPSPIAALNAQPLGPDLHPPQPLSPPPSPDPIIPSDAAADKVDNPPPVPPPIPFDFGKPSQ